MVNFPSVTDFLDCLNSFESFEKPSKIIEKCSKAIQMGLNPVDESIVHSLLMSIYAKQGDLEKAQEELLRARETIGKVIGLTGEELQRFIWKKGSQEQYFHALDDKVDWKEKPAENNMLGQIMLCPLYPTDFREDVKDREKRDAALRSWSDFPGIILYLLLGNLWAAHNIDYAIKCLKILKRHEINYAAKFPESPPSVAELAAGYKLGMLYKDKGDITSAEREFKEALSALSHPAWHTLQDDERELGEYWIFKAKGELADIERQLSKGRLFGRFRKFLR